MRRWGVAAAAMIVMVACRCDGDEGSVEDTAGTDSVTSDTGAAEDTAVAADTAAPADTTALPVSSCTAPAAAALAGAAVPDGFCAATWASGIRRPRGMTVAPGGDILVVERDRSQVLALWDADGDGVCGADERAVLAQASGLNHGLAVGGGYLYASSPTTVTRWAYADGARSDLGSGEAVVTGIPGGGHATRTLALDDAGRLYVSVGSAGNVDRDASRSRIRRFDVSAFTGGSVAFGSGEVFADGLRNEVGLAWDGQGRLWGVQNGVDNLSRADLGGDIHEDNPAEILSLFDTPGAFHGYPYCWTEFLLPAGVGTGRGSMWAHPNSMNDGTHDDAWCRDTTKVDPPELAMQAHSAPLGLRFYDGQAFPQAYRGDLFVAFHGSWNRTEPTGYKVVRVPFDDGLPTGEVEPFLEYGGAGDIAAAWPHRPVDIVVAPDGRLLISSDGSGEILVVGYDPGT